MLYFIKKYRALLFATALLFSGLVILTGTHENRRDLGFLDRFALNVTGILASGIGWVGDGISGLWNHYVFLVGVRSENERLKAEVERLQLEQARLVEAGYEAERLRNALAFRDRTGFKALPASVIGSDASGWFRAIIIDRGSADGIERGMAVITPDGVVGRTHEVAVRATKVLLITDSNSSVDGIVQRTRARGVVAGRVTPVLEMRYVHRTEQVRVGDVVITSGMGGIFPKGLPIGVITHADEKPSGLFRSSLEVTPAADLGRLEEVLVVTVYEGKDYEPVVPAGRAQTLASEALAATAASAPAAPAPSPAAARPAPAPSPAAAPPPPAPPARQAPTPRPPEPSR